MSRVSLERLEASFRAVSAIGALPGGGCERLAFSAEERAAHAEFRRQAEKAGMTVRVDPIGNSFARLEPTSGPAAGGPEGSFPEPARFDEAAILTGSHLDTVARGGCFDGAAGVLCSLEAVIALAEAQRSGEIRLRRPVVVVAWANEEGARFAPAMMGSAVYAGVLSLEEALAATDRSGVSVAEALAEAEGEAIVGERPSYPGAQGPGHSRPRKSVSTDSMRPPAAYLELHIEQGVELEEAGVPVAVVEGVQAQIAGDWEIRGRSAHAGATPMHRRADALVAAAELVSAAERIAGDQEPGVATVGSLAVEPGSRNSVPGAVKGSVDLRHPDQPSVAAMEEMFIQSGRRAAAWHRCTFSFTELWRAPRVSFNPDLLNTLEAAAQTVGISGTRLFSAAGHDAVHIARVTPTAMLFVPSIAGVSHHPEEQTPMEALMAGAQVLEAALLQLAVDK
jgi:N-carbamoyl-L-amino-acid hydrolase